MSSKGTLKYLVSELMRHSNKSDVTENHLWYAIRGALKSELLISNLAEALRAPATETEQRLVEYGFGDIVAQNRIAKSQAQEPSKSQIDYQLASQQGSSTSFSNIFSVEFSPPMDSPIKLTPAQHEATSLLIKTLVESVGDDAFTALYRKDVMAYYDKFMEGDAKLIEQYISDQFKGEFPRYLINSGIGANEQFNHFLAQLNNADPNRRITWLIIDSPRHLTKLPEDATIENTIFMEFSRSGKTEETVKIHEFTPRQARRIVFANSGPLREIGIRDNNLVLELPDQVSGRFGRNKTPILLAPMHVAGMDTERFWRTIQHAIEEFDLSSPASLPLQMSQFLYVYQQARGINHIYFGCNDDVLAASANELLQFWNEGVNKDGNDISMSGYFGLLRDSHATVEGILGNYGNKMGIFLLREHLRPATLPPMTFDEIDPINEKHEGLRFGDDEIILAEANYQRFAELMPTIKVTARGELTPDHAAILGQLWSDVTFCYSKMVNVDPGSNPEVKYVRDRSAQLLAERAQEIRRKNSQ